MTTPFFTTVTKPTTPAGTPTATVANLSLADSSGLPCGTIDIGNDSFAWEIGYLDSPTIVEDPRSAVPSDQGEHVDWVEDPDWTDYLTHTLGQPVAPATADEYAAYINATIERAASAMHTVMSQALDTQRHALAKALNS